jgi:Reticulon
MKLVNCLSVYKYIGWEDWKKSTKILVAINMFIILRKIGYSIISLTSAYILLMWLFVYIFQSFKPQEGSSEVKPAQEAEYISKEALETPLYIGLHIFHLFTSTMHSILLLKDLKRNAIIIVSVFVSAKLLKCCPFFMPFIGNVIIQQ